MSHKSGKTIYTCPMHTGVREKKPGRCPKCGMSLVSESGESFLQRGRSCCDGIAPVARTKKEQAALVSVLYTCPMHPEIVKDRPGMCPECGMNLVQARMNADRTRIYADRGSAGGHTGHSTNIFKRKFWISLVLSIPVVLYSDIVAMLLGWRPPQI